MSTTRQITPEATLAWQTHPRYDQWRDTWQLLSEVAEGDGGFLNGDQLVPHPRELIYKTDEDGTPRWDEVLGEREKFRQRRRQARYENFATTILDTFTDYQYAKPILRTFGGTSATPASRKASDYERWIEDVDGEGTHLDDWLAQHQMLVSTFGHVVVVLDRETAVTATNRPRSRAEEGRLVLRVYIPLDVFDWIAQRTALRAVKLIEAKERTSLNEAVPTVDTASAHWREKGTTPVEFRLWTDREWELVDEDGRRVDGGKHAYGEVPALIWYARRRPRVPLIGRSLLGDGRLFKDHYNLVSELRELERNHAFSFLNVQLQPDEDVTVARARLGDQLSSESIAWTRGPMLFVAPAMEPIRLLLEDITNVERKMYRLVGLPWEGDSAAPESGDSRRLKAMDLNRLLAGHAQQAERFEYALARLWHIGTYGRERGLAAYEAAELQIVHPQEFHTEAILDVVDNARAGLSLGLGPTANGLIRRRALPIILPDLTPEQSKAIGEEIDEQIAEGEALAAYMEGSGLPADEATPPGAPAQDAPSAEPTGMGSGRGGTMMGEA